MDHHIADQIGNVGGLLQGVPARGCGLAATPGASFPREAKAMSPAQIRLIDAQLAAPDHAHRALETGFIPGTPEFDASAVVKSLMGLARSGMTAEQGEAEMQDHDDR